MNWWCIYSYAYGVNHDGAHWIISTQDDLPASVPRVKVEYAYDHQGRMVWKEISRKDAKLGSRANGQHPLGRLNINAYFNERLADEFGGKVGDRKSCKIVP